MISFGRLRLVQCSVSGVWPINLRPVDRAKQYIDQSGTRPSRIEQLRSRGRWFKDSLITCAV